MVSTNANLRYVIEPQAQVQGCIRVPGDKSISHRSIMLGSLATGITTINGFLEGEDSLATLHCFQQLGVEIERKDSGQVVIEGVGLHGLKAPDSKLYLGNSGTSMRLLSGLLCGQNFNTLLTGDESLNSRPMRRIAAPIALMGGQLETSSAGTPPIKTVGSKQLVGIEYLLPVASAQVKSAILLAGLYAQGETAIMEPQPTRDHTERMLRGFGYQVSTEGNRISLHGGGILTATDIDVPSDISSAAFFMVAASICPGSDVTLQHVGVNPTRTGIINILKLMGADITISNEQLAGGEPVADIRIRYAPLRGIRIPVDQVPLAIDEFPVLFIAAACARGKTLLTNAEELRHKESDRIAAMATGLQTLGIDAKATADGITIQGGEIQGGEVDSYHDHRIAMAFTMASLRSKGVVQINRCNNVATSFPGFVDTCQQVGIKIKTEYVD